ncbi:MAG: WG repeat-containing protein, partial [Chitinophagaceae bacterium]|nr:WG repeat-containing protein [Chitinophagaceae bacterium]
VSDFSEGLAAVKGYGGKWGFIDKTGKEVIKCTYDNVYGFKDGIAWVEYKDDWGLIDKTEKVLLPFCYNQAISLGEGLYKVKYNYEKLKKEAKKYDALKEVMGKQSVGGVTKGYILDGGIIDKTGKELNLKNHYQEFRPFSEGLAAVKRTLWDYIDTTGKVVIDGYYRVAGDFKDGKAKVTDDKGREFYIDKTGKEIK